MLKRVLTCSVLICISLAAAVAQQVPRPAGDWKISTVDGGSIALSQYKGKAVVLAFILTTCPHCRMTVGYLSKDQLKFNPRGLQVVASAIDQGVPGVIPEFLKEFGLPFPVGYNTDGNAMLAFLGYDRNHLPHMPILLFIDRQGVIREQHEGSDELNYFNEHQEQNLQKSIEAVLVAGNRKAGRQK